MTLRPRRGPRRPPGARPVVVDEPPSSPASDGGGPYYGPAPWLRLLQEKQRAQDRAWLICQWVYAFLEGLLCAELRVCGVRYGPPADESNWEWALRYGGVYTVLALWAFALLVVVVVCTRQTWLGRALVAWVCMAEQASPRLLTLVAGLDACPVIAK